MFDLAINNSGESKSVNTTKAKYNNYFQIITVAVFQQNFFFAEIFILLSECEINSRFL
jgi:hypothetical protein